MAKSNQYSALEKFAILQELETGRSRLIDVAQKYGISKTTLVKWRHQYQLDGSEGLEPRKFHKSYPEELKLQAVMDYLSGNGSQYEIIDKYKIASRTQLQNGLPIIMVIAA
ncbi:helix-turn-helix domain-containing protein [Paenibacillus prosopidis]|uniref:Transposase n=1 Tax=Paenibacillus prosopidis TaxID=630520 RepID=A0A368WBT8_9BACL|nr:helix-turn-helix domain-containing protein [Paenibacillus prosopidis]RCW50877.1 transposase [Paenibacillus prosopidis]